MSLPTTMPCCSCSSRAWRSRASNSSVSAREGVHSVAFVDHTYRYTRHESLGFQQAESLDTPQSHEPEIGSGGRQARLGILGLQRLPSERLLCSQRELGTDAPMARGRPNACCAANESLAQMRQWPEVERIHRPSCSRTCATRSSSGCCRMASNELPAMCCMASFSGETMSSWYRSAPSRRSNNALASRPESCRIRADQHRSIGRACTCAWACVDDVDTLQ